MQKYLIVLFAAFITSLFAQTGDTLDVPTSIPVQRPANLYYAADQSVIAMPTAYTMEQGTWAFTDYELVGLQLSHAITTSTHLSVAMVFPVTSEMIKTFTLGVKHNYFQTSQFQSALWASYIINPHVMSVGNVFSIGSPQASVHLGVGTGTDFDHSIETIVFMLGGMKDISSRTVLLGEFLSTNQELEEEGNGLISIGLRFKGRDLSWDIGAFRPLNVDGGGDFVAFPFVKATYVF